MLGRAWPLMLKILPIMLFAVLMIKQIDILISKILDTVNNLLKLTCIIIINFYKFNDTILAKQC